MSDFTKKLGKFIDDVCPGDIAVCEDCPHSEGGFCMHPEHPSVKGVGVEIVRERAEKEVKGETY